VTERGGGGARRGDGTLLLAVDHAGDQGGNVPVVRGRAEEAAVGLSAGAVVGGSGGRSGSRGGCGSR
jgi:hypothetical protein